MRDFLISVRKQKGKTVDELASKLGISASFYYKIEQGVRNPTIHLAKRIAEIFDSTVDELFFTDEIEDMPSNGIDNVSITITDNG